MSKIFELREYMDGGPNDRGWVIGYAKGRSREEVRKKLGLTHNFIQAFEISEKEFNKKKREAWNNYKMYRNFISKL